MSGNKPSYLAWQIRKLQIELEIYPCEIYEYAIWKPKHMHWKTFEGKANKLVHLQAYRDHVFATKYNV